MGLVIASASMSLDGYIDWNDNTIGRLFDWLQNRAVEFPTVNGDITLHLSPPSAEYWKQWLDGLGALVCGRTLFDFTGGWGGTHPVDVPVVVVTHKNDVRLDDPTVCIQGDRVTHLVFPATEQSSEG